MTQLPIDNARRGRQLLFALISLAISGVLMLGYVFWSAHSEAWRGAQGKAESYAEVMEVRLGAALRQIDLDLQQIAREVPLDALASRDITRLKQPLLRSLATYNAKSPDVAGFNIVDAKGNVLYQTAGESLTPFIDSSYVVALGDKSAASLAFSTVVIMPADQRPVMAMARALRAPDGQFLGALSVVLDLNVLIREFNSIPLPGESLLAIRRLDTHALVMRQPILNAQLNQSLAEDNLMRQQIDFGQITGANLLTAPGDGLQRMHVFRVLVNYPFYVIAALSKAEVDAEWQRRMLVTGSLGIVLFLALSWILIRLFRDHEAELAANQSLRHQQDQLREAQRLARVGSWELDLPSGRLLWSDELYHIFERDPAAAPATYEMFLEAVHPEDRDRVNQAYLDSLKDKTPYQIEHRLLMPDGRIKIVLETGQTYYSDDGSPLRSIGTAQDISSMRQMEAQMQLLGIAFQHSGEAILISDRQNKIVTVNPAFTELTGYTLAESLGRNPSFLSAGRNSPEDYAQMWRDIHTKGFWQGEIWDRRKDGAIYPKWMSVSVISDDNGDVRYHIAHFTDISAERASEEKLHYMAHHDSLTGLPNRLSLAGRVDQALAQARRDGGRVALLFIDLDRFKSVNDTLGHHIGDLLLIEVAHRLQNSVRDSDVVARIGGDEFVIMLTGIEHTTAVATVAEKIVYAVGDPYVIDGHDLYTSPSIGIAIFPTDGDNSVALLKNADAAMYHAKSAGRNNFQFFDAKMNEAAFERLKIEHGLRHALAHDEFCLYYQPIIEVSSGRVIEVEALVRWMHPEQGLIAPGRFINIAEETGLIQPLGDWVFWTACRQLADFYAAGIDVKIGINVSAMQMRNGNLPILARGAIEALGLRPQDLIFEITESVAMQQPQETVAILDLLHDMGVLLAIDDFGTGYSSLSYLKMFPIDHLKLDRSFVEEIGQGEGSTVICDATIGLAHNLGLKLVAEGVETEAQFDYLRQRGCDLVQGYLFSRPVPAAEVIDFIRQRNAC